MRPTVAVACCPALIHREQGTSNLASFVVPGWNDDFRWAAHSCNGFSLSVSDRDIKQYNGCVLAPTTLAGVLT